MAADVATCQNARLVAIADDDVERGRQVAERFGVERMTAEAREIIADESIDAIVSFVSVEQNPAICIAAALCWLLGLSNSIFYADDRSSQHT